MQETHGVPDRKFQITNLKSQINSNFQFQMTETNLPELLNLIQTQ